MDVCFRSCVVGVVQGSDHDSRSNRFVLAAHVPDMIPEKHRAGGRETTRVCLHPGCPPVYNIVSNPYPSPSSTTKNRPQFYYEHFTTPGRRRRRASFDQSSPRSSSPPSLILVARSPTA